MKHTFICAAALLLIVLNTVAQETQKKKSLCKAKSHRLVYCAI